LQQQQSSHACAVSMRHPQRQVKKEFDYHSNYVKLVTFSHLLKESILKSADGG
jgi:hypothetical protein